MAFDDFDSGGGSISQINVTPLVDVMLVLLVIFMVTSPILQQGVELDLPKETLSPIEGEGEQLVVSIVKEGNVYIGKDNEVPLDSLGERLSNILSAREDKRVFIKGFSKNSTLGNALYGVKDSILAGVVTIAVSAEELAGRSSLAPHSLEQAVAQRVQMSRRIGNKDITIFRLHQVRGTIVSMICQDVAPFDASMPTQV